MGSDRQFDLALVGGRQRGRRVNAVQRQYPAGKGRPYRLGADRSAWDGNAPGIAAGRNVRDLLV